MSVRVMSRVWEHSHQKGSALLLLVAIADSANDQGVGFAGVEFLKNKVRMSKRNTQVLINQLEQSGEVYSSPGVGRGNKTFYAVLTGLGKEAIQKLLMDHFNCDTVKGENLASFMAQKMAKTGNVKGANQRQEKVQTSVRKGANQRKVKQAISHDADKKNGQSGSADPYYPDSSDPLLGISSLRSDIPPATTSEVELKSTSQNKSIETPPPVAQGSPIAAPTVPPVEPVAPKAKRDPQPHIAPIEAFIDAVGRETLPPDFSIGAFARVGKDMHKGGVTPDVMRCAGGLVRAWHKETGVVLSWDVGPMRTIMRLAYGLCQKSITSGDVQAFLVSIKGDKYKQDKAAKFGYVAENIAAWKGKQTTKESSDGHSTDESDDYIFSPDSPFAPDRGQDHSGIAAKL